MQRTFENKVLEKLDGIDSKINRVEKTLDKHTKMIAENKSMILENRDMILENRKILDGHTKILDNHTKILDCHTKILDSHTKMISENRNMILENKNMILKLIRITSKNSLEIEGLTEVVTAHNEELKKSRENTVKKLNSLFDLSKINKQQHKVYDTGLATLNSKLLNHDTRISILEKLPKKRTKKLSHN